MKKKWDRKLTVLVVTMLVSWGSPGCEDTTEMSGDDMIVSAIEEGEGEGEDTEFQAQSDEEEVATAWPEGWMVVHQEEWIPVLDDLGRRLHSARRSLSNGDRTAAAADVRSGLVYLEAQVSDANERDQAALARAIATLRAVMDRLSSEEEVTLEQLDIAFANAYRSDLEREALVVQTGSAVPYLERPEAHLNLAIERFLANDDVAAAREVDRASAFLRLEGNRLDLAQRALLIEAAQDLEHVAARLRLSGIRERTELDRVFDPVNEQWRALARASSPPRSLGLTRGSTQEGVVVISQDDGSAF